MIFALRMAREVLPRVFAASIRWADVPETFRIALEEHALDLPFGDRDENGGHHASAANGKDRRLSIQGALHDLEARRHVLIGERSHQRDDAAASDQRPAHVADLAV